MKKALQAIAQSWSLLRTRPSLALPFVLFALLEGITLYLLFLAPQEPFSKLLALPIVRFFGEQAISYPGHILVLPQLSYYYKATLAFLPGMFISAFFIGLIGDIKLDRTTSLRRHIKAPVHRFFALLIIWGLGTIGVLKLIKLFYVQAIGWSDSQGYLTTLQYLFHFLSFWSQILFIYALPLIILAEQSLFRALIGNFRYLGRLFMPTTICAFLSAVIYLVVFVFDKDLMQLAARTAPEIIVVILAVGIPVTLIINLLMITATTLLFIDEQKTDSQVSIVISKEASS